MIETTRICPTHGDALAQLLKHRVPGPHYIVGGPTPDESECICCVPRFATREEAARYVREVTEAKATT